MSNSTHRVEVVPIKLRKHENADSLSVVDVFGGYTCVVRTQDWHDGELGAYVPPDSLVDTSREEFSFLAKDANASGLARVRAKKFRGVQSFGMLVKPPAYANGLRSCAAVGDDVTEELGVTHYEPPIPGVSNPNGGGMITGGEAAGSPMESPKYDLEAFRKYHHLLQPGELVHISEKIHGCSARYVYVDGKMHCGSRGEWKKEYPSYAHITLSYLEEKLAEKFLGKDVDVIDKAAAMYQRLFNGQQPRNLWWNALDAAEGLAKWCQDNHGVIVYGEVFGQVQTLRYGATAQAPLMFAAFDLFDKGRFVDMMYFEDRIDGKFPVCPCFRDDVPYDFDTVANLSDGESLWFGAKHYREGCVVKPMRERYCDSIGRLALKCVGATYLEKDK